MVYHKIQPFKKHGENSRILKNTLQFANSIELGLIKFLWFKNKRTLLQNKLLISNHFYEFYFYVKFCANFY